MQLKNSRSHFGVVSIVFHWVMAILLITLLALGLYMTSLPINPDTIELYGWHKELGMLVLMLVIARSIWRVSNVIPRLALPWWEALAARVVHYLFYVFMFALPITGWLMSSAAGFPVSFFNWFIFPDLISPNPNLMKLLEQIHEWLAYGLIATTCLHILAALKHHFIDKDDIMRRMM